MGWVETTGVRDGPWKFKGHSIIEHYRSQPFAVAVSNLVTSDAHVQVETRSGANWELVEEADVPWKNVHVFMLGDTTTPETYLADERNSDSLGQDL